MTSSRPTQSKRMASFKILVQRFDDTCDQAFDKLRGNPIADRVFYSASSVADFGLIWIFLGGVQGLTHRSAMKAAVRVAACEFAHSALVNGMIKPLFKRERPLDDLPDDHAHPLPFRVPVTSSFPSGHGSASFCAATLLAQGSPAAPLYFALAAVVASSRVYTKAHHASDVVGGVAIGLLLGQIAKRTWKL